MTCTSRIFSARWVLFVLLGLAATACNRASKISEAPLFFRVPNSPLLLPHTDGWQMDTTLAPLQPEQAGVVLKLVPQNNVPGAPTIQVTREGKNADPTALEAWLTRGLREMGDLETRGQIRILHVEQKQVTIGHAPAYRVQHEFTMGERNAAVSLYQIALFFVLDGRGMTVSAAGRTELFHPLAQSISDVLDHMVLGTAPKSFSSGPEPIDLGRIGGP